MLVLTDDAVEVLLDAEEVPGVLIEAGIPTLVGVDESSMFSGAPK